MTLLLIGITIGAVGVAVAAWGVVCVLQRVDPFNLDGPRK